MGRVLESGHYYRAKGATLWSVVGWEILSQLMQPGDTSLLYIDDVHKAHDVHPEEKRLEAVTDFNPHADITVLESQTKAEALEILTSLLALSNGKRPKFGKDNRWYCSGFPITNAHGEPLCVLLDAGLTLLKSRISDVEIAVNILPCYYELQQRNLMRLITKALPDFSLQTILYDLSGKSWTMQV